MKLSDFAFWRNKKKIQESIAPIPDETPSSTASDAIAGEQILDEPSIPAEKVVEKDVSYWVGQLSSENYAKTAYELNEMASGGSEEALQAMVKAMEEGKSTQVRVELCDRLRFLDDNIAYKAKAIINCIDDPDENVRIAVCNALKYISANKAQLIRDSGVVPQLFERLHENNEHIVSSAGGVLANLNETKAIATLVKFLPSVEQTYLRENICDSLGKFGNEAALDALLGVLDDSAYSVKRTVIKILGRKGDSRVIATLKALLNDPIFGEYAEPALANLQRRGIEGTDDVKNHQEIKEDFKQKILAARELDRAWVNSKQTSVEECWALMAKNFPKEPFKTQDLIELGIEEETINLAIQAWQQQGKIRTVGLRTFELCYLN